MRDRAASLAAEAGVTIEHIGKAHIRKEDVVARVLEQRGDRPGLVHILSAMGGGEACDAYQPWHDKKTHRTFVRPDGGKCLHHYFYFQDARFGLGLPAGPYLRPVPTAILLQSTKQDVAQAECEGHRQHQGRQRLPPDL